MKKSPIKLFLDFNMWLIKNMNKFFLWLIICGVLATGLRFYGYTHNISWYVSTIINIFIAYALFKIILK